jgi:hypothetical protein
MQRGREERGSSDGNVIHLGCSELETRACSARHGVSHIYVADRDGERPNEGAVGGSGFGFESYTGVTPRWCSLTMAGVEVAICRTSGAG